MRRGHKGNRCLLHQLLMALSLKSVLCLLALVSQFHEEGFPLTEEMKELKICEPISN